MKRIGDILTRNKTPVVIEDGTSYKQVTIRTNYKGVVLRGYQAGSTIGTKNQFTVTAGQFILSRIDARNGAFGIVPKDLEGAIVTNDFLAFDINEDEVERDFFNVILQSPVFLEACVKASRGNTNRKRVEEHFFLNYEVNLPMLREQRKLIKKINKAKANIRVAQSEITREQSLLAKLKQAILQDAIQGKLTGDWRTANPDVEPAGLLLRRVMIHRSDWIRVAKRNGNEEANSIERKLMKLAQTSIPTPVEQLPRTWQWTTLIQSNLMVVDCHNKTAPYSPQGVRLVRTTNVRDGRLRLSDTKFVSEDIYRRWSARCIPQAGDLIFTREAPVGEVGQIPAGAKLCLGQRTMLIRPIPKLVSPDYLLLAIQSPDFVRRAARAKRGAMVGHLRVGAVERAIIPLPPLDEQTVIVERVAALMKACRALETEIEHSRTDAAHLLQAVLKEAFTPACPSELFAKDVTDERAAGLLDPIGGKPVSSPVIPKVFDMAAGGSRGAGAQHSKGIFYRRAALDCYVIEKLSGDPELGRTKLEKLCHLLEHHCCIDLEREPIRDAAGPNDSLARIKVESLAKKQEWYSTRTREGGAKIDYLPGPHISKARSTATNFIGDRKAAVDALLAIMRPLDTKRSEVVATLYASWNDFLLAGKTPTDDELVQDVRTNWHPQKQSIPIEWWLKTLSWMRRKHLVPTGSGRPVARKPLSPSSPVSSERVRQPKTKSVGKRKRR